MGDWSSNYKSWKYYQARKIHLVRYEDMMNNSEKTFRNILDYLSKFLPLKLNNEKIKSALEITSFSNLTSMEKKTGFTEIGSGEKFFRKGEVGEWKKKLDPKLANRLEEAFKKEMIELNYL